MAEPMKDLPWPRGRPPRFKDTMPKYDAPHWKTSNVYKCASCGSHAPCVHKNQYLVLMNSKFQEGSEHRPEFMLEGPHWRKQLSKEEAAHGRLKNGQPLPPGTRHGWGSYPGSDALVGSPRRHGEWKLVYVPASNEKKAANSKQNLDKPRSKSQLSYRSRIEEEEEPPDMNHRDILSHRDRVLSPATMGPYSTVQNMAYHSSFRAARDEHANAWKSFGCTTPDLVRELNDSFPSITPTARSERPPRDAVASRRKEQSRQMKPRVDRVTSRREEEYSSRTARAGSDVSAWMDKTSREERVKKLLGEMPDRLRTQMEGRNIPFIVEETQLDDKVGGLPVPHFRQRKPGEALESFYWAQSRKPKRKKKLKGERAFRW